MPVKKPQPLNLQNSDLFPDDGESSSDDSFVEDISEFAQNKKHLREQFLAHISQITDTIKRNPKYQQEGQNLYDALEKAQETLLKEITEDGDQKTMQAAIDTFTQTCKGLVKTANKIMGHSWLYRVGEVLLKGIGALLAGIGITVFTLGIGWASKDIRQSYKKHFFTLNQTPESEALSTFDETQGTPKKPG